MRADEALKQSNGIIYLDGEPAFANYFLGSNRRFLRWKKTGDLLYMEDILSDKWEPSLEKREEKDLMYTQEGEGLTGEKPIDWISYAVKEFLDKAPAFAIGYATKAAMKHAEVEKPELFKKCECCGGQYNYATKWASEHPHDMVYGILKYYLSTLECKHEYAEQIDEKEPGPWGHRYSLRCIICKKRKLVHMDKWV